MIAKIVAAKGGGDFARLGRYITDAKKDSLTTAAERLALYVTDAAHDGEKVAWSRVSNCGSDDPRMAMLQIRNTQARNTRATNKTLHLVVSFPAGERPSDTQLHQIEDALCAALGMADHQRLSALHTNTDHVHLHVALNRIHPESLRCVDPSFGQRKLMTACHQLEITLELTRTNHGLSRDDASHAPIQGRAADMEAHSGVESFARWVRDHARDDLLAAKDVGWPELHKAAAEHGLEIKLRGAGLVFVDVGKPERAVKASSVDRGLSMGAVVKACGTFQPAADKVPAREVYKPQPLHQHAKIQSLYARYQAERAKAQEMREQKTGAWKQEQRLYRQVLTKWYAQERHKLAHDWLAALAPDKRQRYQELRQQRDTLRTRSRIAERDGVAKIRKEHPLTTWQGWLQREAGRDNRDALAALRNLEGRRDRFAHSLIRATNVEEAKDIVLRAKSPSVGRDGTVSYRLPDGGVIQDRKNGIVVKQESPGAAALAVVLAGQRFNSRHIQVEGSPEFKRWVEQEAARPGRGLWLTQGPPDRDPQPSTHGIPERAPWGAPERQDPTGQQYVSLLGKREGEYVYLGVREHGGVPSLIWQRGNTLYTQAATRNAMLLAQDVEKGDTVMFHQDRPIVVRGNERDTGMGR